MPTRGFAYAPTTVWAVEQARRCGPPLLIEIGSPVELARTKIVRSFLATAATHLMMIDDDILPPEGAVDRLLALDADVATAPCPIFLDNRIVANVKHAGTDEWVDVPSPAVFAVSQTGLGLTLIRRHVFERIRMPWFQSGATKDGRLIGEDVWFSNGVTKAGLTLVCDGTIRCRHIKGGLDLLAAAGWGA